MFTQAGLFLLDAVIGFFTFALLLRFYMQAFRVSFRNQVGAFVVQLTNGLVMPLRKVLPGLFGLDLASLLLAYVLQALLFFAVLSLRGGLIQGLDEQKDVGRSAAGDRRYRIDL